MLEQPIVYRHACGHADMCIGMYAGMRIDIYTNMSMDMCMDMYTDMRMDVHTDMYRDRCAGMHKHICTRARLSPQTNPVDFFSEAIIHPRVRIIVFS